MTLTSRLPEDQPCDCFRVPHAFYCAKNTADLVPGYHDSPDGVFDAADQRKWDEHTAAAVEKILGA